jgi:hypothetical protein
MEIWQNKIRHFLPGWAKNLSGVYNEEKERLLLLIDELDVKAESSPLSAVKRAAKTEVDEYLAKLRCNEETKWTQRAKVKHVQEGGNNIKYFHFNCKRET